ncbi:MAG TPA: tetratricopeptide repeat protein [Actinomycetes bacterium]|nr:tetratricopeptide repeat protein [Actinomycetes bacterium]
MNTAWESAESPGTAAASRPDQPPDHPRDPPGRRPPTSATSLHLAIVLRDRATAKAPSPLECALAVHDAHLGPDHPTTAQRLDNLALVLYDQGDLNHARTLHERALTIHEARLGPDHPDTVRSRERLAVVVAALENRE